MSQPARTILVADDEAPLRSVMSRVLEYAGFRVLEAVDGAEALRLFQEADPSVDLVLTDIRMPEMDGVELATRVLAIRPDVRVVFVSGYLNSTVLPEELQERKIPLIGKPFEIFVLVDVVRAALDGRADG